MSKIHRRGLVILSGGQDSVTCLGVALQECDEVEAVGFYYGQRHEVEIEAASVICRSRGVPYKCVNLQTSFEHIKSSALIDHNADLSAPHTIVGCAPASFVPARNAIFLTVAFGVALEGGMDVMYTGVSQTDYSGYPDCRETFIERLMLALNTGYEANVAIRTPLMHKTKAETFQLAKDTGILEQVLQYSVTCYEGVTDKVNDWGLGCGECPSCKLRAKGWEEYINTK
jgi:7-cyano-7-deazaguanine synthase